jgi:hypothetical protein
VTTERDPERPPASSAADEAAAGREPDSRAEVDPDVAELLGLRPTDADPVPDADELDTLGEMTDTRIYQGDLEARPLGVDQPDDADADNLESLLSGELRDGETDDPNEAAEEGLVWVPPMDPPTSGTEPDGDPIVAAGFGTTAQDEPFDADHHGEAVTPLDEIEDRVLEALRADASTTGLVDNLEIDAEAGIIRIAGSVPDVDDEDAVVAVASEVDGVREVDSRLRIEALEGSSPDIRD